MEIGISLSLTGLPILNQGGGFDALAAALSPAGEDYAFYDFSQGNGGRLFQENTGPTAASAIGNVIGLSIGREKAGVKTLSEVLSARPEMAQFSGLSTNGTNRNATGSNGTLSFTGGVLTINRGTTDAFAHPMATSVGKMYMLTFRLVSGIIRVRESAGSSPLINAGTTFTKYLISDTIDAFAIWPNGTSTTAVIDQISLKEVPAHYATQSSASLKSQFQAGGAKFDGSDDSLLSDWLAQAGENCIIAQVDVPATISGTQMFAGANESSEAARIFLSILTDGKIAAGHSSAVRLDSLGSYLGQSVVAAMTLTGSVVSLFVGSENITATQNSQPTTTIPFRIGARNNANTAGTFFSGSIKRLAFGRKAITLAQFQSIRAQWLATA